MRKYLGSFICGRCGHRFHSMKALNNHLWKFHKIKENPGTNWHVNRANQLREERHRYFRKTGPVASEQWNRLNYLVLENELAAEESRKRGMNPKRKLSVPEQHQLKIAKKTLTYSDFGAKIMGGPTKAEAREIIKRLTGKSARENPSKTKSATKSLLPILVIGGLVWLLARNRS